MCGFQNFTQKLIERGEHYEVKQPRGSWRSCLSFSTSHVGGSANSWNSRQDLGVNDYRCSPSNQTEPALLCKAKWAKFLLSRCANVVETFVKRLAAVNAAKVASTMSECLKCVIVMC
ncbi:hypothetical protein GOODEAATRI_001564 [Goodea atripinnis]|uniref:Uncharacterized protein n=1 Tax=Goodea atripinnis TaxID=208336 RepID=A0ABV0PAI0_9TELE